MDSAAESIRAPTGGSTGAVAALALPTLLVASSAWPTPAASATSEVAFGTTFARWPPRLAIAFSRIAPPGAGTTHA